MIINWNEEKNKKLKEERAVGFEDIEKALEAGEYIIIDHPNQQDYSHQQMYVVALNDYVYMIPFVDNDEKGERFLKTIIPSRKMKKQYPFT